MPEEVNRVVTDALSDLLFATSPGGAVAPGRRGRRPAAQGAPGRQPDDRQPVLRAALARPRAGARARLGLPERYAVATLHRPANVDDPRGRPASWSTAVLEVASRSPIVVPIHPRGRSGWPRRGWWTGATWSDHRPAGLRGLPLPRPGRGAGRHRLRRRAGGDDHAGRALPDRPAQHRAADHHHARHQPAGHPRPAARRGREGAGRRRGDARPASCPRSGTAPPGRASPG